MTPRREFVVFALVLGLGLAGLFRQTWLDGQILSPADVLRTSVSLGGPVASTYEAQNRLQIDAALQFEPWMAFAREQVRSGRLPLWNPDAGCGAPFLANGQSAIFDPIRVIAYLGTLPEAHAAMAWARLWIAGLGAFLLARAWGYRVSGRWFAGLCFPFCGFLIVWLPFPVTSSAVWLPWLILATDRLLDRPTRRRLAATAIYIALPILGGHIQTAAHVLLAGAAYAAWKTWDRRPFGFQPRGPLAWLAAALLGMCAAAVVVLPLGGYLSRSPVWEDRTAERPGVLTVTRPRILDAACTATPYLYGSQRQGHPNLAKALGVHNLNESAGGFAGLACLAVLAPCGWTVRRWRPQARFLAGLTAFGVLAAFEFPPVANLLRALPVLQVTDNRRMTLYLAFGLVMLGGIGLDHLAALRRGRWVRSLAACGLALAALGAVGSLTVTYARPWIVERAERHYRKAAPKDADPTVIRVRARRQVEATVGFLPRYGLYVAANLAALSLIAGAVRTGRLGQRPAGLALLGLNLIDVFAFADGLNPTVPRSESRIDSPVIDRLREVVGTGGRILPIGEELPPNVLMRYGLADVRNYDSIELSRSLAFFDPLYEPARARTSRRDVTWSGVLRARERLREASVLAIVSVVPPPPDAGFGSVEQVGGVWIAWLDAATKVEAEGARWDVKRSEPGSWDLVVESDRPTRLIVRETYEPGWIAQVDGADQPIMLYLDVFMRVDVGPGTHHVVLRYEPLEVKAGIVASMLGWIGIAVLIVPVRGARKNRSTSSLAFRRPVTIDSRAWSTGPKALRPTSPDPEGRHADGPLYV